MLTSGAAVETQQYKDPEREQNIFEMTITYDVPKIDDDVLYDVLARLHLPACFTPAHTEVIGSVYFRTYVYQTVSVRACDERDEQGTNVWEVRMLRNGVSPLARSKHIRKQIQLTVRSTNTAALHALSGPPRIGLQGKTLASNNGEERALLGTAVFTFTEPGYNTSPFICAPRVAAPRFESTGICARFRQSPSIC